MGQPEVGVQCVDLDYGTTLCGQGVACCWFENLDQTGYWSCEANANIPCAVQDRDYGSLDCDDRLDCQSGEECCYIHSNFSDGSSSETLCLPQGSCRSTPNGRLTCNTSAECMQGEICCRQETVLFFRGDPGDFGTCLSGDSCPTFP